MPASPSTENYFIGKGNVYFKRDGESEYRHVGNVPEFELTPEVEELEHFSSMAGTRTRDRTVVLEKSMTLRMVMEEWTIENLAVGLLGAADTDTAGRDIVDIFEESRVSGEIKLIGSNEVGAKFLWHFPKVDFIPGSSISPITDEWGSIEVNGEVAKRDNNTPFGRLTLLGAESSEVDESVSELLAIEL
jgi:hypothetical protein